MSAGHHQGQGVLPLSTVDLPLSACPAHQAAGPHGLAGGGLVQQLLGPARAGPGHQAEGRLLEEQSETITHQSGESTRSLNSVQPQTIFCLQGKAQLKLIFLGNFAIKHETKHASVVLGPV